MSKIEEALKKAKLSRQSNSNSLTVISENKDTTEPTDIVELKQSYLKGSEIRHQSSAKEISLMEDGDIFDNDELSNLRIIYSEMADKKVANTYRDLRTKLIQKSQSKNFIAMITSCANEVDSAMTSLNIATAFSFDESKTSLLIDCNLNNPQLDTLLNMEADKGLTDYMENESIQIDTIMHKTGIKRLKMIPAGVFRETATEYFTSLRLRQLMSDLLARYSDRFIFLDTAPITESADTRILVELCDFVILAVPYGKCTKSKVKEAVEAIGEEKLLGVVFTDKPKLPKFSIFNLFRF
jgi:protein-tyrosine kinase